MIHRLLVQRHSGQDDGFPRWCQYSSSLLDTFILNMNFSSACSAVRAFPPIMLQAQLDIVLWKARRLWELTIQPASHNRRSLSYVSTSMASQPSGILSPQQAALVVYVRRSWVSNLVKVPLQFILNYNARTSLVAGTARLFSFFLFCLRWLMLLIDRMLTPRITNRTLHSCRAVQIVVRVAIQNTLLHCHAFSWR